MNILRQPFGIVLVMLTGITVGMVTSALLLTMPSVHAQSSNQSLEVHLTEKGKQKVQITNGLISSTTDKIDYKQNYIIVTSRDTDRRTWVLAVDDIKVISPDRQ